MNLLQAQKPRKDISPENQQLSTIISQNVRKVDFQFFSLIIMKLVLSTAVETLQEKLFIMLFYY